MKSKAKWGLTLSLIFLLSILAGWRYRVVNRGYLPQNVKEVVVKRNQTVKDPDVHFKILRTQTKLTNDEALMNVTMSIDQVGPSNYGFKTNNPNFDDNMWFNIPYGYYSMTKGPTTTTGKALSMNDMSQKGRRVIVMSFRTPRDNYASRNATPRFSFLVPHGKQYMKYSYLLDF